jgi:hypothetical protein
MVGYGPVKEQIRKLQATPTGVENETQPDGFTKEA